MISDIKWVFMLIYMQFVFRHIKVNLAYFVRKNIKGVLKNISQGQGLM